MNSAKQATISRFFSPPKSQARRKRSLSPIDLTLDSDSEIGPRTPKKLRTSTVSAETVSEKPASKSDQWRLNTSSPREPQSITPISPEQEASKKKRREAFRKKLLLDNSFFLPKESEDPGTPPVELSENEQEEPDAAPLKVNAKYSRGSGKGEAGKATTSKPKKGTVGPSGLPYTPLELQVVQFKKDNPQTLLMVEVGYKYRFFGEDAHIASNELGIVCYTDRNFSVASIPLHRRAVHLKKLLSQGHKVGIIGQVETAALKKAGENKRGPFERKLIHLYTSTTYIEDLESIDDVDPTCPPSLMCIIEHSKATSSAADDRIDFAIITLCATTGDISWDYFSDTHMRIELESRLAHVRPTEILISKNKLSRSTQKMIQRLSSETQGERRIRLEQMTSEMTYTEAFSFVTDFYLEGLSSGSSSSNKQMAVITDLPKVVVVALACSIRYMSTFNMANVFLDAQFFSKISSKTHMLLSASTLANLEIYRNETDYTSKGSLMTLLDRTKTKSGARMLRNWIGKPLVDKTALQDRFQAVEEILVSNGSDYIIGLRNSLDNLPDLGRGLSQIQYGKISPVDLAKFLHHFHYLSELYDPVDSPSTFGFKSHIINGILFSLANLRAPLKKILEDISLTKASKGQKTQLWNDPDKYPGVEENSMLVQMVDYELEAELKDIRKLLKKPSLKWTTHGTDEYLVEVQKHEDDIIPKDWHIVSRTRYYNRYHSPTVKDKIDQRAQYLESLKAAADDAYLQFLRELTNKYYEAMRNAVSKLAVADCLFSLSLVARFHDYVRPEFTDDDVLILNEARHPMLELLRTHPYTRNNIHLGLGNSKAIVCTGPNMGGKSSMVRMVALLAIMSQIGCYVPATSMRLGMLDGIYTRMGASDNLARGKSTFMVEMTETSDILRDASARSLVILDELGRGTSTFDGMAVASAVLQHLVQETKCKTLFITHYPSVAMDLERRFPSDVQNHHMSYVETNRPDGTREITFLYRLVKGVTTNSFGIECARLAGVAENILLVAAQKASSMKEEIELRKLRKRARQCVLQAKHCLSNGADYATLDTLRQIIDKST